MELRLIIDPEKVFNEEIRRCAKDGSKSAATKHFVAIENDEEVAFAHLRSRLGLPRKSKCSARFRRRGRFPLDFLKERSPFHPHPMFMCI
jgi:hypothetical protein